MAADRRIFMMAIKLAANTSRIHWMSISADLAC